MDMGRFIYLKDVVTLALDEEKCIGCGMCSAVCPHTVFAPANGRVRI
jgi:Fe-S-cluster-containing hydrogenase component 2